MGNWFRGRIGLGGVFVAGVVLVAAITWRQGLLRGRRAVCKGDRVYMLANTNVSS